MKNNNTFFNWNVKKIPMGIIALIWVLALPFSALVAQTTVFSEDFNRATLGTTGGTPSMTWTQFSLPSTNPGAFSTNLNSGSDYCLVIQNNAATPQSLMRSVLSGPLSTITGLNTTLSSNTGVVTWTFNMKTNRTTKLSTSNTSGYYGATILAASAADITATTTNGYAVVLFGGNTNDAFKLVKFAGGLQGDRKSVV